MTKQHAAYALLLAMIALLTLTFAMGWHHALTLETLKNNRDTVQSLYMQAPLLTSLAYIIIYAVVVAFSLPFGAVMTLMGGFLFGAIAGTLLTVIGATAGATGVFLIARSSLGATLRQRAGGFYQRIENNMTENAASYLLFMRLVPLFPFALVNIVAALFNVPLRVYVLTTFIGIIPGTFVFVNLGNQLGHINTLQDAISPQTLGALALLGVFALLPNLYTQLVKKKKTHA